MIKFVFGRENRVRATLEYLDSKPVLDIQIGDLNGDGLKDMKIITYFPIALDDYRFEWVFCQMENGLFYREEQYEEWKTL